MSSHYMDESDFQTRRSARIASGIVCHILITQGKIEEFAVRDMTMVLNMVETVRYEAELSRWEQITFSLGSLLQVALLHAFQAVVEELLFENREAEPENQPAPRARSLLHSYVEEYSRGDYDHCQSTANEIYHEMTSLLRPLSAKYRDVIVSLTREIRADREIPYKEISTRVGSV